MIDYLLRFEDESAAIAALPDLHDEESWTGDTLPVVLVTAEAEYAEPDEDGGRELIADRVTLPGFFLLTTKAGQVGQVAEIERETGRIIAGDESLAGARFDPAWAGGASVLTLDGSTPEPAPVPAAISDRQFAQQLAVLGTISEEEALAWAARGELPEAMETAIAALPEEARFSARMLLSSATTYERAHPLVPAIGGLLGYDAAEIDDIWRAAALL